MGWPLAHAFQHVFAVSERLYVIELCGGRQGNDGRPARCAPVGSGERMVLAAGGDWTDGLFHRVGVEFETPVKGEFAEGAPTGEPVPD